MTVFRGILMTWPGRIFALALVGLIAGGAVFVSRANAPAAKTELRTQAVTKGSVIQSVAVSGSVAAMNQTKMSFKSTGKISEIYVSVGQQVIAGQALAKLDTTDLETALAQAQANLVSAQNNYNRTASTTSDAQKALNQARQQAAQDLATAQAALNKLTTNYVSAKSSFTSFTDNANGGISSFQDSLGTIQSQVDTLIAEMSRIVGGGDTGDLRSALNAISGANSPALQNARANSVTLLSPALADYLSARSALLSVVADFDYALAAGNDTTSIASSFQLAQTNYSIATSRLTNALDTTSAVLGTVQTAVTTAQASLNTQSTKTLHDPFDQWRADLATLYTLVGAQQQNVSTVKLKISQATSYVSTMNDAIGGSIATATQNVSATAQRGQQSIDSAQTSLNSKPYDLTNSQASVDNAASAVQTAQANLDNAVVTAPSSGVVASIASQVGETAANPFMVLANTTSLVLHGTIGESDVAKVKLGLVANVAVDAVSTAGRMTGRVTSLDPVATIQSGVPVYGIDVTIDLPNSQVKPGMTGTATVIIASRQNVLTVPNLAIRTTNGRRYLQILKDGEAVDTDVVFGISNDTTTEVISGVAEGDLAVLPAARATATARPGAGGGGFGGGGPVIVGR
ncbi:MAG: biotin/lipoyl-binding protein [Chloroflexi bacterium]|nr:MAG: biotin/lipoyl-binding protein [Chloroflexota bacterium]